MTLTDGDDKMTTETIVAFAACDGAGVEHRASDPNEAGYLARKATPRNRRDTLVCAVKLTDAGNEYQVPVGYFTASMAKTWEARRD